MPAHEITDTERFEWYFGKDSAKSQQFITAYLQGVREGWTTDRWRTEIDKAIKEEGLNAPA